MSEARNLRIGVPSKGRLQEPAERLLHEAGLVFRRQERTLFARCQEVPLDVTFIRAQDVPVLVAEGALDLGITGQDLVAETGVQIEERLVLGFGRCRLAVCVPEQSGCQTLRELAGGKLATSFPGLTKRHLAEQKIEARVVELGGSLEVMVSLGLADAIVDLVETGSTLAANQLRVLSEIGLYQAVLVQNGQLKDRALADRVVRRIEGVVIAREYSLLEYNVPRDLLRKAKKITPGFESPTVSALEEEGWCAVKVMVKRAEVIDIMERLEELGATAILETQITNCRL